MKIKIDLNSVIRTFDVISAHYNHRGGRFVKARQRSAAFYQMEKCLFKNYAWSEPCDTGVGDNRNDHEHL